MYHKVIFFLVFVVILNVVVSKSVSNDSQNSTIICKLPEARGFCRALLPRWRYNPETRKCQEFHYGGCDGNANNFKSEKACMSVCAGV